MSAVDDIRKVLQDLVTPDLKALETHVQSLDEKMDARFKQSEEMADARFKHLVEKMDLKFDIVAATMAANQATVMRSI
jgi:hypothetical protein